MLRLDGVSGRRYLVLGLGRSGRATIRALLESGADAVGWDDDEAVRRQAEQDGIGLTCPDDGFESGRIHTLVVSPGVPVLYPKPGRTIARALAAGVKLTNDIGLFFASIGRGEGRPKAPPVIAAVTGSNGKSTTSALIHHLLVSTGATAELAGNIGKPVLEMQPGSDYVVLEISSYQAELAHQLDPDVAVFLNFSPDHVDRHGGVGGYFAAKQRLFDGPSLGAAVIGTDQTEGRYLASWIGSRAGACDIASLSSSPPSGTSRHAVIGDHSFTEYSQGARTRVTKLDGCPNLRGRHNAQNSAAACLACQGLGVQIDDPEPALETFPGLPHRMQVLGTFGGVLWVNDSKATNCESAAMALNAFSRIRWIAGGQGKAGGLSVLAGTGSLANVEKAYLIGASARDFAGQLAGVDHLVCGDLERAVWAAIGDSAPGDTILLSPAAASFDQYRDFEARGSHFRDLATKLSPDPTPK